jgi:hypothetical protein
MDVPRIVIVGAGVAGLACARELARRGVPAITLERAGVVGGRCATRRVDGRPVDYGTFYLHARSGEFGEALLDLDPAGRIDGWPSRVRGAHLACQPDSLLAGRLRLARRDGVVEFPEHLAREVPVRLRQEVTEIEEHGRGVRVRLAEGDPLEADIVVLAGAVTQSLALAEPLVADWHEAAGKLARIRGVPVVRTLTVLAGYGDTPLPDFDVWFPAETTMLHGICNDSSKRPPPCELALVLQARPGFSNEFLDRPPEEWAREMLWEAGEVLAPWAARPRWMLPHAWRSARVLPHDVLGDSIVFEREPHAGAPRVAVIGDAFARDAGLEAAYMSGIAMGERLATLPEVFAALKPGGPGSV